jgi:hypothetical protein
MVRYQLNEQILLPNDKIAFPRPEMPPIKITYVQCKYEWEKTVSRMTKNKVEKKKGKRIKRR